MTPRKPKLNHELLTDAGTCAACEFLKTAIKMMGDEYKPEYEKMLADARREHETQLSIFEVTE